MGIEDEVLGTLNLLQMDLGVLEGQTSRGLFSNSIFDPSVIGAIGYPKNWPNFGVSGRQIIKSILKFFEFPKTGNVLLSEIEFRREARCRILEIQKF